VRHRARPSNRWTKNKTAFVRDRHDIPTQSPRAPQYDITAAAAVESLESRRLLSSSMRVRFSTISTATAPRRRRAGPSRHGHRSSGSLFSTKNFKRHSRRRRAGNPPPERPAVFVYGIDAGIIRWPGSADGPSANNKAATGLIPIPATHDYLLKGNLATPKAAPALVSGAGQSAPLAMPSTRPGPTRLGRRHCHGELAQSSSS